MKTIIMTIAVSLLGLLTLNCSSTKMEVDKPLFASDHYEDDERGDSSSSTRSLAQDGDGAVEDEYKDDDYGSEGPKTEAAEAYSDITGSPSKETSGPFRRGMYVFLETCEMKAEPTESSGDEGTISIGKKLWVVGYSSDWHIVHKKKGDVYIASTCSKRKK